MTARNKILVLVAGLAAGCFGIFSATHRVDYESLHIFDGHDGEYPGPLTPANDGAIYGTTWRGGSNRLGTVFKLSNDGAHKILHSFNSPILNDYAPALVQGMDGRLYGATCEAAMLYAVTSNGALTVIHQFTNGPDGGCFLIPRGLMPAGDGSLYCTSAGPEPSPPPLRIAARCLELRPAAILS